MVTHMPDEHDPGLIFTDLRVRARTRLAWCIALFALLALVAFHALADGQHAAGPPPPACPPGTVFVRVSIGQEGRIVYAGCLAAAELERAGFRTTAQVAGAGEIVCRTLIVRTRTFDFSEEAKK